MTEIKWLNFINGSNSLMIKNKNEFDIFKDFICDIGLNNLLKSKTEFCDWQNLAVINGHNPDYIIFEMQPGKGLTFGYTEEESKKWFGEDSLNVSIFDFFYENSQIVKDIANLSEVYNNTHNYVLNNWYKMGYSSEAEAFEEFGLDIYDVDSEMEIS